MPNAKEKLKKEEETWIANRFCVLLDSSAEIVDEAIDERAGDVLVRCADSDVCVQLVAYLQSDEQQRLEKPCEKLEEIIAQQFSDDDLMGIRYQIFLGASPRIPKREDRNAFARELVALAEAIRSDLVREGAEVCFLPRRILENVPDDASGSYVAKEEFPTLSLFCNHIVASFQSQDRPASIVRPIMGSRWLYPDTEHLERVLGEKLEKTAQYREYSDDRGIWLLIHSDGDTLARMADGEDLDTLVSQAKKQIEESDSRFDQHWWIADAKLESARIISLD